MTREQALNIIGQRGEQAPHGDIAKLCAFLRISREHFWEIAERFRNPAIWSRRNGKWVIEDFIIPDWKW